MNFANKSQGKVLKQASLNSALAAQRNRKNHPETEYVSVHSISNPESEYHPPSSKRILTFPETETPRNTENAGKFMDFIGDTPLVELTHMLPSEVALKGTRVLAKCEFFNPGFSIKDRIVRNILDKAEASGALRPGMTVVAASSGNTGAATAMMCAQRGYKCIITTCAKCSKEKCDAIRAYGAELLISPDGAKEGTPAHYMDMARDLALQDPSRYFDMDQYETQSNPEGHFLTLGPEIWDQTEGCVTHLVCAGSTGGTISGTARYLKEKNPSIEVVLADPVGSIFTEYFQKGSYGQAGKFLVEGVGKGSIPGAMNFKLVDDVLPVHDHEAFAMCHKLAREEGICAGGSSGLNVYAALKYAASLDEPSVVVTVMPDLGVKYLSKVYNNEWLAENGFVCSGTDSAAVEPREPERAVIRNQAKVQFCFEAARYGDLVGDTPLVDLSHLVRNRAGRQVQVYAKCEFFNPGFSIKDRIVQNILNKAESSGALQPGMTVVAASSGNTGAATAMMCAMRGYKCIITTSPKCSKEKQDAIKAYGAELLLSPDNAKEGSPQHYMEMARLLALENPELYFDMDQYETQSNPEGHYLSLGPEIWEQASGRVTHFIAAGSTGGTISGTSRYLKEQNEEIQCILADPVGSIFSEYHRSRKVTSPGKFLVEGVGKGSIPGAMNFDLIDDVIPVTDQEAFDTCFKMARVEGICAGGSSGLNLCAALKLAENLQEDATIVTVFPDLGVKYLSKVYNDEWLVQNGLEPPGDRCNSW
jgi:cysteine synthase